MDCLFASVAASFYFSGQHPRTGRIYKPKAGEVCGGSASGLFAVFAEFIAEGADADAEKFCGVGAVLAGLFERAEDMLFFDFGERDDAIACGGIRRGLG